MTTVVDGCVLCPSERRNGRAVFRGRGWVVLPHPTPAAGRRLLLVPDEHHEDLADTPPWLMAHLGTVLAWVRDTNRAGSYVLVARGGDPAVTGALWRHAHLDVAVGDNVDVGVLRAEETVR